MKKWGLGGEHSFWSVAIAAGFYCLILGISIGSMFDKPACTGSNFGCFEFWINRYQTLLTAFGVIFAVAIAKAQMEANRRQHVAQIKRSFQKELDDLNDIKYFAENAKNSTYESAEARASQDGIDGLIIDRPVGSQLKKYREILPHDIADMTVKISKEISALFEESRKENPNEQELNLRLSEIKMLSGVLLGFIEARHKHLSQYWS